MGPVGEDGPAGGGGAGGGDEDGVKAEGGLGAGGSSYVPPHLRKGGAGAGAGERMGGKYERDDLATLRVTNVSIAKVDHVRLALEADGECRSRSLRKSKI